MSWTDEAAERIYIALATEIDEEKFNLSELADDIASDLSASGVLMPEYIEPDHSNVYYLGTRRVEMHDSFVKVEDTDRYTEENITLTRDEAAELARIILSNES